MIKETIHKGSCIEFNNGSTLIVLKGKENARSARSSLLYCVEMKPCLMGDFLQQYEDDIDNETMQKTQQQIIYKN